MPTLTNRSTYIAGWIRQRVNAAGARGLVVGLSGGVDSAVAIRLCQMAMPGHVIGVTMPCQSDPRDESDAQLIADHFSLPTLRIDLEPAYTQLTGDLASALRQVSSEQAASGPSPDLKARVPLANVKPRMRMATLYFVANSLNYLVAGTGNRSELTIGYFTKYGDGGVDLLPLGALLKSEVRELARELEVPESVIEKSPSAGLWIGQTDEDEMGFTYEDLERYLSKGAEAVAPALAMRIERLMRSSEHKRSLAPTPPD
jgi:NAD+ synthase